MMPLNRAFETLALTLPRFDSLAHAATALAVVYQSDIETVPLRAMQTSIGRAAKLSTTEMNKLVTLVLRDLQDWGRAILVERGLGNDDDVWGREKAYAPGHAKIIQDTWDALPEAPVWTVIERQFATLMTKRVSETAV